MNAHATSSLAQPAPGMSTWQLRRNLDEIDHVMAAMRLTMTGAVDDGRDLAWLQERRRYVLAVLAGRKALQERKIVNLEQWRSGGITLPATAASAA